METDKRNFLLLRGLMREQRHWEKFPQLLQARFPEARIITLDIPGNGLHYQCLSPKSISKITDCLRSELYSSSHVGPINIIALSMGGMAAIDWMCRYRSEITSAVLINTSASSCSPFFQRLRWQNYPAIIKLIFLGHQRQERKILELTSHLHRNDTDLLERWYSWRQQHPVSKKSTYNQLIASSTFTPAKKPEQPLLLVASKCDRLVDYRCSLALQKSWQSDYLEHPSAGHDLPLDDPEWLAENIVEWYSNVQNQQPYLKDTY